MNPSANVKETVELVDGLLGLIDLATKAQSDGKIDIMDLPLLLGVIPLISPAVAGVKEIPAEIGHISSEDAQAVVAHVMAKLAIENAKAVAVINEALATGIQVSKLVKAIKA